MADDAAAAKKEEVEEEEEKVENPLDESTFEEEQPADGDGKPTSGEGGAESAEGAVDDTVGMPPLQRVLAIMLRMGFFHSIAVGIVIACIAVLSFEHWPWHHLHEDGHDKYANLVGGAVSPFFRSMDDYQNGIVHAHHFKPNGAYNEATGLGGDADQRYSKFSSVFYSWDRGASGASNCVVASLFPSVGAYPGIGTAPAVVTALSALAMFPDFASEATRVVVPTAIVLMVIMLLFDPCGAESGFPILESNVLYMLSSLGYGIALYFAVVRPKLPEMKSAWLKWAWWFLKHIFGAVYFLGAAIFAFSKNVEQILLLVGSYWLVVYIAIVPFVFAHIDDFLLLRWFKGVPDSTPVVTVMLFANKGFWMGLEHGLTILLLQMEAMEGGWTAYVLMVMKDMLIWGVEIVQHDRLTENRINKLLGKSQEDIDADVARRRTSNDGDGRSLDMELAIKMWAETTTDIYLKATYWTVVVATTLYRGGSTPWVYATITLLWAIVTSTVGVYFAIDDVPLVATVNADTKSMLMRVAEVLSFYTVSCGPLYALVCGYTPWESGMGPVFIPGTGVEHNLPDHDGCLAINQLSREYECARAADPTCVCLGWTNACSIDLSSDCYDQMSDLRIDFFRHNATYCEDHIMKPPDFFRGCFMFANASVPRTLNFDYPTKYDLPHATVIWDEMQT